MTASLGSETVAAVGRCSPPALSNQNRRGVLLSFCKSTQQPAAKNSTECARSPLKTKDFVLTCLGGHRTSSYGIFRSASTVTAGEGSQLGNTETGRAIVRRPWQCRLAGTQLGILHHIYVDKTTAICRQMIKSTGNALEPQVCLMPCPFRNG